MIGDELLHLLQVASRLDRVALRAGELEAKLTHEFAEFDHFEGEAFERCFRVGGDLDDRGRCRVVAGIGPGERDEGEEGETGGSDRQMAKGTAEAGHGGTP